MKSEKKTKAQLIEELNYYKSIVQKLETKNSISKKSHLIYKNNIKAMQNSMFKRLAQSGGNSFYGLIDLNGKLIYYSFPVEYEELKEIIFQKNLENQLNSNLVKPWIKSVVESGNQQEYLYEKNLDNKDYSFNISLYPIKKDDSEITSIFLLIKNITDQINKQNELKEKRIVLRQVLDLVPHQICAKDINSNFLLANKAMADCYNTTPKDLVGKNMYDLHKNFQEVEKYAKDDLEVFISGLSKFIPIELFTDANGNKRFIQSYKIPLEIHNTKTVLSVSMDVTDEIIIKEELKESENKFHSFITQSSSGIILTDEEGIITEWNSSCENLTGLSFSNVKGKYIWDIFYDLTSDQVNTNIFYDNFKNISYDSIIKGNTSFFNKLHEYVFISNDGCIKTIQGITFPIKTHRGIMIGQVMNDITEQIKFKEDLIISEQKLREANKSKDVFLSIIAHDLRNQIGSFIELSRFLSKDLTSFSINEIKEISQSMQDASLNLLSLLENLLNLSRSKLGIIDFSPEHFDFKSVADNVVEQFKLSLKNKKIKFENHIKANTNVFADIPMVMTVLRNLVSNAIKFTNEHGKIIINAKEKDEYVEISIHDNGVGIDNNTITKLFRLDNKITSLGTNNEQGTGLGLILCQEFIQKNKGKISVKSKIGAGTNFCFTIPRNEIK